MKKISQIIAFLLLALMLTLPSNAIEYGRKPYLCKSYREMLDRNSNFAMWSQIKSKHSELEKPYFSKPGEYAKMQHYYPNLPGLAGIPSFSLSGVKFDDMKFDHPWMGRPVDDAKKMFETIYLGFLGCGFEFPGLFSSVAKCETRCVYLDNWHMHRKTPGGPLVPDDPIASWSVTGNAVITGSDIFHACVKVNEDATEGDQVRITATTVSGHTCDNMGWVKGDDCSACIDDAAMAYDYGSSAATVAQNNSCTVVITGLNTPFTWSVSGTGFTLDNATTEGLTNTLNADGSACGSATITVTGCDGTVATGYVRCTTGTWTSWIYTCGSDVGNQAYGNCYITSGPGRYYYIDQIACSQCTGPVCSMLFSRAEYDNCWYWSASEPYDCTTGCSSTYCGTPDCHRIVSGNKRKEWVCP